MAWDAPTEKRARDLAVRLGRLVANDFPEADWSDHFDEISTALAHFAAMVIVAFSACGELDALGRFEDTLRKSVHINEPTSRKILAAMGLINKPN